MSVSTYQKVIQIIAGRLSTVEGIGNIHEYFRYTEGEAEAQNIYYNETTETINCWMITRRKIDDKQLSGLQNEEVHYIEIEGWVQMEDVERSEIGFQELIDLIRAKFTPQDDLDETSTVEIHRPILAPTIGHEKIIGVYCHHVILSMEIQILTTSS